MKLGQGSGFATQVKFPGVLPSLPNAGGCDPARLATYLNAEASQPDPPTKDTYWEGKHLGKLATLIPIAEQFGVKEAEATLRKKLKARLEHWFTAAAPDGQLKSRGLFYYNANWGALIGCPASYGSDTELNDHHFHYGYFAKAAAEIARRDPDWAADERWGGMVKLLIRDFASPDRKDPLFPFLRSFDPYAGHSWASGHARFGDGNNNESSSEAMNAWAGLVLWGEATGDRALRDLGIFLYTTEMTAIHEYWFDVHAENFPKGYTPSVVTMIWGGKGANGTWFSANPEMVHGINFLPMHGGSLYLGHYPDYVRKNYKALVEENKGTQWDAWADIIWMYLALADPKEALAQFEAREKGYPAEAGNTKANTYHWLHTLNVLGHVDPTVTADTPLYAVFRKGSRQTYVAYNMAPSPRTVTFSDGFKLEAKERSFATGSREADPTKERP
jgi:endoglucanase Acf2